MGDLVTTRKASMRPRRKCLGYAYLEALKRDDREASMRPRRKCLGYLFNRLRGGEVFPRFNEAEA